MYILETEQSFDSAHFLSGYEGKCSNLHGHRWRVVARIAMDELNKEGQTIDMVIEVPFRPTAEQFSRYFYEQLKGLNFPVYDISVYETPTNCSTYREASL